MRNPPKTDWTARVITIILILCWIRSLITGPWWLSPLFLALGWIILDRMEW